MVDRSYILNSALRASTRKNNVVALAFLRALGWSIGAPIGAVEESPDDGCTFGAPGNPGKATDAPDVCISETAAVMGDYGC